VGLVLGIAACGRSNTIDYLFVASAKNNPGQLEVYYVDNESGVLTPASGSPYTTGRDPVSLATSPNQQFVYVLNYEDNTIVSYSIGANAALTKGKSYTTPGSYPTSMKINVAGTFLYVLDSFQSQYSPTNPGPGAVVVYPINTDGSLGSPTSYPVCNNPVDLTVLNNGNFIYVVDDPADQPPKLAQNATFPISIVAYQAVGACAADSGQISAFNVGSGGTLTQVSGSPFAAGTTPGAIASTPSDNFVYVTDRINSQLLAYTTENDGALLAINNGPFITGNFPDAVTVDPRGLYVYVANYSPSTISVYSIAQSTGIPGASATGTQNVDTGPTFVFIEPNAGKYLYTSNFVEGDLSGLQLNANTGALTALENSPFPAAGGPTAIAAVTHGNHPTEVLPQY